jgi:hypothetical protein
MANDRISGQVIAWDSHARLYRGIWVGANLFFMALWCMMFFMTPWINSMEDETSDLLSRTLIGRQQIALSSLAALTILALVPAVMSYGFSRLMGMQGGRPLKTNRPFKVALVEYLILIVVSAAGAISFVAGHTLFNPFGF